MRELSLNVMDVAQNSISAGATLLEIAEEADTASGILTIRLADDGCGMTPEQVASVTDPFYTTRTTRSVGLGIPLFKMAAEMTGGDFHIKSTPDEGTLVQASFFTSHIDMTPVGNMNETVLLLVTCNPDMDFVYKKSVDDRSFTLDTRQLREVLGPEVPLCSPDVVGWMRQYLQEQQALL